MLEAKLNRTTVQLSGTYERSNPFAGVLSGGVSNKTIYRADFKGQVRGNVIFGHVKRTNEGQTRSLLGLADADVKTIMVFNGDHSELFVMEHPESQSPEFYSLTATKLDG